MSLGLGVVLSVVCLAGVPAPVETSAPAATPSEDEGPNLLRTLDFYAEGARRGRIVRSSLDLVLAGTQLGLGIYGVVAIDDRGVRRSGISQIVAGSVGLTTSVFSLAAPSPLERLRRSDAYRLLSADPSNAQAVAQLRLAWASAARRARKRRLATGGLNIALGTLLTAGTSVQLATANSDAEKSERAWAYSTLTSAVGLVLAGVVRVALPGEDERSFAAYEAGRSRRAHVRLAPSVGGFSLVGRF
jgi:hypothetical protein